MAKIRNFDSFGLYFHISARINVKFGKGEQPPLTLAKFQDYWTMVLPLRDEKPIFGPLSKNSTSMAALCACLPLTEKNITLFHLQPVHKPR